MLIFSRWEAEVLLRSVPLVCCVAQSQSWLWTLLAAAAAGIFPPWTPSCLASSSYVCSWKLPWQGGEGKKRPLGSPARHQRSAAGTTTLSFALLAPKRVRRWVPSRMSHLAGQGR